jgi:hypothetical protein
MLSRRFALNAVCALTLSPATTAFAGKSALDSAPE